MDSLPKPLRPLSTLSHTRMVISVASSKDSLRKPIRSLSTLPTLTTVSLLDKLWELKEGVASHNPLAQHIWEQPGAGCMLLSKFA
jgi:hypothetical protein